MSSKQQHDESGAVDLAWAEHHWRIGIFTDTGRQRDQNEDSVSVGVVTMKGLTLRGLAALADGVGGQAHGEEASQRAVRYLQRYIALTGDNLVSTLRQMIALTNTLISASPEPPFLSDTAEEAIAADRPATTIVALLFEGNTAIIGNVGDSRAYRLDDTSITQLSRDHIDPAFNGALTQSLGAQPTVDPHVCEVVLRPGEIILLCSDGLTNELRDQEIHRIFLSTLKKGMIQEAVQELGEQANLRGGHDNISIIAVAYDVTQPQRASWRQRLALPYFTLISLLIGSAVLLISAW
jgi:protein phosphatase